MRLVQVMRTNCTNGPLVQLVQLVRSKCTNEPLVQLVQLVRLVQLVH